MSYYLELADWHWRRTKLKVKRRVGAKLTFKAMTWTGKLERNADTLEAGFDKIDLVVVRIPSKRLHTFWFGPSKA